MIPVLFTYNGAMVANFMATEVRSAARALPLGLWVGMAAVVLLYLAVNLSYLRALGVDALARSAVPASAVFLGAFGPIGSRLASLAIAIATLGFISNRMLTVPRLYHAMAEDGLFFRRVAWIDPRTHVPVVAIVLQGALRDCDRALGRLRSHLELRRRDGLHLQRPAGAGALRAARARPRCGYRDRRAFACRGIRSPPPFICWHRGALRSPPASPIRATESWGSRFC